MDHRHRVLVVEDDPENAAALQTLFESYGFDAVVASDGEEALLRLRMLAADVCVVVLDLMMPRMDGWEFRLHQSRDPRLARIPVVIVTGGRDVSKVATLGAAANLVKPLDASTLIGVVDRLCADVSHTHRREREAEAEPAVQREHH